MRLVTRSLGALAVLALVSGCGPAWKVLKASGPPSALEGKTDIGVVFDYTDLTVGGKPESQWVEKKVAEEPKYADTWADLKAKFETAVMTGVQANFSGAHLASASPGQATMVVSLKTFQLGKYIVVGQIPSVMSVNLQFKVGDAMTDEISFVKSYPASVVQPSVFNHVPHIGDQVGRMGGQFLTSKQPEKK